MRFLLDTNVCSEYLKRPGRLAHRFVQHSGGLAVSAVVLAELYSWVSRRHSPKVLCDMIEDDLLECVSVIEFDHSTARRFGLLRGQLLTQGLTVDALDLMIAATALEYDLVLVTTNTRHFANIPGLQLEDWLAP
jgi:tRNA(fMet)-specific endonuclease VapC